jgi:hypothetical protein
MRNQIIIIFTILVIFCYVFYTYHSDIQPGTTSESQAIPYSTFNFDFHQFQSQMNTAIMRDMVDTSTPQLDQLHDCIYNNSQYICHLSSGAFYRSAKWLNATGMLTGYPEQQTQITLILGENNRIESILLDGNQGDPVNFLDFIASTADIVFAINPLMLGDIKQIKPILSQLGFLHNNVEVTAKRYHTVTQETFKANCLVQNSSITQHIQCLFTPI